jgi:hypothetical protein
MKHKKQFNEKRVISLKNITLIPAKTLSSMQIITEWTYNYDYWNDVTNIV